MVKNYLERHNLDVIVNCAAYTDVGKAENDRGDKKGLCWQINVEGVLNLLNNIDPIKTHFIQVSTDMVFLGSLKDLGHTRKIILFRQI